jgi:hypothetical protein
MPCYQVNTFTTEFKADRLDLLRKAIAASGAQITSDNSRFLGIVTEDYSSITIDLTRGTATADSLDVVNALKRAYSLEVIKAACGLNNWLPSGLHSTATEIKGTLQRY